MNIIKRLKDSYRWLISNLDRNQVRGDEVPDRKCLICGDRATGLHYGIISCEGLTPTYCSPTPFDPLLALTHNQGSADQNWLVPDPFRPFIGPNS